MNMKIRITFKFEMWETVFLKTDSEHLPRLVCGYEVDGNFKVFYKLACGDKDSLHYAKEISRQKTGNPIGFKSNQQ